MKWGWGVPGNDFSEWRVLFSVAPWDWMTDLPSEQDHLGLSRPQGLGDEGMSDREPGTMCSEAALALCLVPGSAAWELLKI